MQATAAGPRPPRPALVIALPAVVVPAAFTVLYSLAHHLIVVRLGWLQPPQQLIDLFGPGLFGVAFGLFVLPPRVRCLALGDRGGFALTVVMALLALLPAIFAQHFVREAGAGRVQVASPAALTGQAERRYARITIDRFVIDRGPARCGASRATALRGSGGANLALSAFFACPLRDPTDTSPAHDTGVWFGQSYHQSLSNSPFAQGGVQDARIATFFRRSRDSFLADDLSWIRHFRHLGNDVERDHFREAIAVATGATAQAPEAIILVGERTEMGPYRGTALRWAVGMWLAGALGWALVLAFARVDPAALQAFVNQRRAEPWPAALRRRLLRPLGVLVPRRGLWATSVLIDVNVIVFAVMVSAGVHPFEPTTASLLTWGAFRGDLFVAGGWWRPFTSAFVHDGVFHLAINATMLGLAGTMLEQALHGRRALVLAVYLLGGIAGTLPYLHALSPLVGASGAVFALFGAQAGAVVRRRARAHGVPIAGAVGVALLGLDLLLGRRTGLAWQAHVAGFCAGALAGALLPYRWDPRDDSGPGDDSR